MSQEIILYANPTNEHTAAMQGQILPPGRGRIFTTGKLLASQGRPTSRISEAVLREYDSSMEINTRW